MMLTMPQVHRVVSMTLGSLGSTAQDWYERLMADGWFGRVADSRECPIARLVRSRLEQASGWEQAFVITVNDADVVVLTAEGDRAAKIDMPLTGSDFVAWFDSGHYPALEVPK